MADGQVVFETQLDTAGIKSGIDGLESTVNKWGAAIVGSKAFSAITDKLIDVTKAGIEYNAQMEAYQTNFSVLLGDQAAALEHVAELREMAAATPFGMEDLASASQTLLSFGASADTVMDSISMLGDISLGNSEKFSGLSLAFAQVSAAGKLTGQDLLQMVNAGFNPLNTIAEATGTNLGDLKEVMGGAKGSKEFQKQMKAAQKEVKKLGDEASNGAKLLAQIGEEGVISAEMVGIAMQMETSPGGRFYNGMEQASKTVGGLFSTLKDDALQLAGNIFAPVSEVLKNVVLPTAISAVGAMNDLFEKDGKITLSVEAEEALSAIETLDGEILAIQNKYVEESIKIKLEYTEVTSLIGDLETLNTKLAETPKNLWTEEDKTQLAALNTQLGELVPGFDKLVGRDGLLKKDAEAVQELATEYYNLSLAQAAVNARAESYSALLAAQTNKDVLVEENKILESRLSSATETKNAYAQMYDSAEQLYADLGHGAYEYVDGVYQYDVPKMSAAITAATGLMQQYIDMNGALEGQAFTDAGVELAAFYDGISFMSPEDLMADADALDQLTEAMRVMQELATGQEAAQETVISDTTASLAATTEAIAAADEVIADAQLRVEALDARIASLQSGTTSIADSSATANEAIDGVQENAEELTAEPYEAELKADDQASSVIAGVDKDLGELNGKTATVYLNVEQTGSLPNVDGSHADGLSYVPYDNYLAYLHKGEMVLTAKEAEALRSLSDRDFASGLASRAFGSDAVNAAAAQPTVVHQTINFNVPVQTPDEFAQTMKLYATYGL